MATDNNGKYTDIILDLSGCGGNTLARLGITQIGTIIRAIPSEGSLKVYNEPSQNMFFWTTPYGIEVKSEEWTEMWKKGF